MISPSHSTPFAAGEIAYEVRHYAGRQAAECWQRPSNDKTHPCRKCSRVIALEGMCACRGLEVRRPLTAGMGSEQLYAAVRRRVTPEGDRPLSEACETLARWVLSAEPGRLFEEVLTP